MNSIPSLVYCCSREQLLLYYQIIDKYHSWDSRIDIFPQKFGLLEKEICATIVQVAMQDKSEGKKTLESFSEQIVRIERFLRDPSMKLRIHFDPQGECGSIRQLLTDRLHCLSVIDNSSSFNDNKIIQSISDHVFRFIHSIYQQSHGQSTDHRRKPLTESALLFHEELSVPFQKFLWFEQSVLMKLPKQRAFISNIPKSNPLLIVAVFSDASLSSDLSIQHSEDFPSTEHWIDYMITLLVNSHVNTVIAQQSIHSQLLSALHRKGITTITNTGIKYLQPIQQLTGAIGLSSVLALFRRSDNQEIPIHCLGVLKKISVQYLYQDCFIILEGLTLPASGSSLMSPRVNQIIENARLTISPILSVLVGGSDDRRNRQQLVTIIQDCFWFLMKVFKKDISLFLRIKDSLAENLHEPIFERKISALFQQLAQRCMESNNVLPIVTPLLNKFLITLLERQIYQP